MPFLNSWRPQTNRSVYGALSFLLMLALLPTVCALVDRYKDNVAIEASFDPILIPIRISVNSWGEVSIETRSSLELPTPLGVFNAGLLMETQPFAKSVENVLVIKIDDQQCAYDLHGGDFKIELDEGNYQIVSVSTEQDDIYVELKGQSYTGCTQDWSTVSVANVANPVAVTVDCPGASPSYLAIGSRAYISVFQAAVLKEPSEFASFAKYRYLDGGRSVTIVEGPVCGPGNPGHVLFWKVRSDVIRFSDGTQDSVEGWIAEESGDIYLMRPLGQLN